MTIDTLLRSYPESVQILTRDALKKIREWLPNAAEGVDASARMVAYSYGSGTREWFALSFSVSPA